MYSKGKSIVYPIVYGNYFGKPISDSEKVFYHENMIARIIDDVRYEILDNTQTYEKMGGLYLKILLIIDIQKYQNNFNKQYLNKVQKFIEKTKDEFDEIVYMVDFTDKNFLHDYVPAFILENTDCMLQKSYTKI